MDIKLSMHQILSTESSSLGREYQVDVVQTRKRSKTDVRTHSLLEFRALRFPFQLRISRKFHALSSHRGWRVIVLNYWTPKSPARLGPVATSSIVSQFSPDCFATVDLRRRTPFRSHSSRSDSDISWGPMRPSIHRLTPLPERTRGWTDRMRTGRIRANLSRRSRYARKNHLRR